MVLILYFVKGGATEALANRLRWSAPAWSYRAERFKAAKQMRVWGWRAWLLWVAVGYVLAALIAGCLWLVDTVAFAHLPVGMLAVGPPMGVTMLQLLWVGEAFRPVWVVVRPGEIQLDNLRLRADSAGRLRAVGIERDDQGRGLLLRVRYVTRRGQERTRRAGLGASIDPEAVRVLFERGTTMKMAVSAPAPDYLAIAHPTPTASTPASTLART